ncbi:MAG: glutamyl-tRNA reductase [Actinobacteria bacterium]|nr:glutamyl-tRNA reductase [Actinomycetota bacterium]
MSLLVVGLSHRTAPIWALEQVSVPEAELAKVADELCRSESISEVIVVSTCNRVEIYADVARFHPAVADITGVLSRRSGLAVSVLGEYLYVNFAEAAAEHVLSVAAGLDSMVVGESQILGQVRTAYTLSTQTGSVGSVLHELAQTALRVGKRVHTDTGIDRAGASIVSVALDHADRVLARSSGPDARRAVIVGAGSMGALAGAQLRRRGVADIVVVNRSPERGQRLAVTLQGRFAAMDHLADEIAEADLVISSTGATGVVVEAEAVRPRSGRPLVILDIAVPHDVDPSVGALADVTYVDLELLRAEGAVVSDAEIEAATRIVAEEVADYLAAQQRLAVAPTVTALRARANQVIDAELARLDARLPGLEAAVRTEVAGAVRRAVEKVLHAPTVRVKELAARPGGDSYAQALQELFDLDPAAAESVAMPRSAREGTS